METKARRILRNSLKFSIPNKKVEIGIYFKEKEHLKRFHKEHFQKSCREKHILDQIEEFVWLDTETKGADAFFTFSLKKFPFLARWYYAYQAHQILKQHLRITRQGFTGSYQYWVEQKDKKKRSCLAFQKFDLYFDLLEGHQSIAITISYRGLSKVLLKHVEELVTQHQMDTTLLKMVIYEKECLPYRLVPEAMRLQVNKVYPILRRELADYLEMEWEYKQDHYKLHHDFLKVQAFYKQWMHLEEMKALFPDPLKWTLVDSSAIASLKERSKKLCFGNGHISEKIHAAFAQYGPYSLPPSHHFKVFIIYPKTCRLAKETLEKHLISTPGYTNLQKYSHLSLVYRPELNIEIQNIEHIESEVEEALKNFHKEMDVYYFAFYISPYPKYGIPQEQQQPYYQIKERLLKRLIVSQVMVGKRMSQNINFWIPNIAISMVAKLGGIPWKLARASEKELIIGFGAFRSQEQKQPYVGSSFCFDNEGHFQEFDCWQEVYEWSFIGSLYQAILKYKEKNKGIRRIVIHYYKELNSKEFKQVEDLLDKFKIEIPVIVIRINSRFQQKELIVDTAHRYHLPMNASYYHLQHKDYLLYINERETEGMEEVKKAAYPLKVSLQSNRVGLFEDEVLVQELMQQLYDFSLLHWRSINQPRLPVTIAYPQYLSRIFPYFEAEILQDIGRTRLWFL